MSDVTFTSTGSDAAALLTFEQRHAELSGSLGAHVSALVNAAAAGDLDRARSARSDLIAWCTGTLVPYLTAEEKVLYPAMTGRAESRLIAEALVSDNASLRSLVTELGQTTDGVRAAATANALRVATTGYFAAQDQQLLPFAAGVTDISLSDVLAALTAEHEPVGTDAGDGHGHDHDCTCGETDGPGYPELDARVVPHAIRHATVFGALDAVRPGKGLILVAPHDPLPLLAQIEQRNPGVFDVSYLERGPEAWRLAIVRK